MELAEQNKLKLPDECDGRPFKPSSILRPAEYVAKLKVDVIAIL